MANLKETQELNSDKYFLYRHIRQDRDEVFYVGIGVRCDSNRTFEKIYLRAFSKRSRNRIWNSIVAKTDFQVEIICTSNNREQIQEKEKEFISLYGRICNNSGTLANFTAGGDGHLDVPKEVWERRKETMIKNGTYQNLLDRIKKNKGDEGIGTDYFVYNLDGTFYKKYKSKKDACNELKIGQTGVSKYRNSNTNFRQYLFYTKYMGKKLQDGSFYVVENRRIIACRLNNSKRKNTKRTQDIFKILNIETKKEDTVSGINGLSAFFNINAFNFKRRIVTGNRLYKKKYKVTLL